MSSMLYTMGMALDRAAENGFAVSLLVEGSWIHGQVAANDGVGVVIETQDLHHCVIRSERIAAVDVHAESPYRAPITAGADWADCPAGGTEDLTGARPMPGPRASRFV
jgi:hypothetical protein